MGERGGCCQWCVTFIFTLGLTALFMWISLKPNHPTYHIVDFYVPALNKTAGGNFTGIPPRNTTVAFQLKIKNKNKDQGVYYDDININVTLYGNQSSSIVGNLTIPHFYQGHHKTARRKELVETERVPWETVLREVSNGTVVFRVDLATKVRFKIFSFKTGRQSMKVGGNVTVNDGGTKTETKGVKLNSGETAHVCYRALVWIEIAVVLFLIW